MMTSVVIFGVEIRRKRPDMIVSNVQKAAFDTWPILLLKDGAIAVKAGHARLDEIFKFANYRIPAFLIKAMYDFGVLDAGLFNEWSAINQRLSAAEAWLDSFEYHSDWMTKNGIPMSKRQVNTLCKRSDDRDKAREEMKAFERKARG
jgi:hypothetical protein